MLTIEHSRLLYNVGVNKLSANSSAITYKNAHIVDDSAYRELLNGILKGEESAIAAFYDMTISRVYAVALRITMSHETAEETVADVYLQVWQQADRFDPARGSVLTWLLTICRSRAIDYLRRRDRAELHPEPETLRPDLHINENDPEDLMSALERNSRLYETLNILSPVQRQLIALAFFKGLSHQEISQYVNLPLGSVKTHIRKALHLLHEKLYDVDKSPPIKQL